ncbi:MAG: calcium/sodium antiporter [Anaerolineae bacterium]
MDTVTFVLFLVGLVVLILGAEALVRGASRLATSVGISPLVVGLTVVAFGTSSPELAVTLQSAFAGQSELAVGNVVGSNIANVLLILGLAAVIAPLVADLRLIRLDVPIMIGLSLLLLGLAWNGTLGRLDGLLLFTIAVVYTVYAVRESRKESDKVKKEYAQQFGTGAGRTTKSVLIQVGFIVAGLAMLIVGSRWLVDGATAIARTLGVSELIIGSTIVAIGTSLPEIAITVMASIKGERDIAVGNAVGSNIANITVVLGLTAVLAPQGITIPPAALTFDIPVMIVVAVACLPIFFTGGAISRAEGVFFLLYYVAYIGYLLLEAAQHPALPAFTVFIFAFALPLTAVTLAILVRRARRERRAPG